MTQELYYLNQLGKECFKLPERSKPNNYLNNNNYLHDCLKLRPGFSQTLDRKNCLSEFSMDEEKAEARSNLGITPLLEELSRLLDEKVLTTLRAVVEQTPSEEEETLRNRVLSTYGLLNLLKNYYTKAIIDEELTRLRLIIADLNIIDETLDSESTNPVLNKIVKDALDGIYDVLNLKILLLIADTHRELNGNIVDIHQELDNKVDLNLLNNYYNKSEVDNIVNSIEVPLPISDYNDLTNKPDIPTDLSDLINDVGYATELYVNLQINNLIGDAPETLDTLKEIADLLDNTQAEGILQQLANKANKTDVQVLSVNNAGIEYVDLKLPSLLLWASCNIGANSPEEYGDYLDIGSFDEFAGDWNIPERSQILELVDYTIYSKVEINGILCGKFTSTVDDSKYIIVPFSGDKLLGEFMGLNEYGYIASVNFVDPRNRNILYALEISDNVSNNSIYTPNVCIPIRPVILRSIISVKDKIQQLETYIDNNSFSGNYNDLINKPTNVSLFINDVGYITQHQSLENYYTKLETNQAIDDKFIVLTESLYEALTQYEPNVIYLITEDELETPIPSSGWHFGDGFPIILGEVSWGFGLNFPIILSESSQTEEETPVETFIDLGLPSGKLWASMNVGASDEYDVGTLYNGENIFSKEDLEWNMNLIFDEGRVPNNSEMTELEQNTTSEYLSNINCMKFTSNQDPTKYIIIPNNGIWSSTIDSGIANVLKYSEPDGILIYLSLSTDTHSIRLIKNNNN